jgi:hypothetical protein
MTDFAEIPSSFRLSRALAFGIGAVVGLRVGVPGDVLGDALDDVGPG